MLIYLGVYFSVFLLTFFAQNIKSDFDKKEFFESHLYSKGYYDYDKEIDIYCCFPARHGRV